MTEENDPILDEPEDEYQAPFHIRHALLLKQIGTIVLALGLWAAYLKVEPVTRVIDLAVNPAVAGITIVYGKASHFIHKHTGWDLGFLKEESDPEFDYRVQLATYINEKQAGDLVAIAVNQQETLPRREAALKSLLKFDSTDDWVQPFLNELPRGGMLGLYDADAPHLDDLMKQIRSEGGIRNSLVRAYGEVAFSFMLQVPDLPVVRKRALGWVNDVLAEDSLFLIIPRIERERDPEVQAVIEDTLWKLRAISDPKRAKDLLFPLYRRPPWPSVRLPLAVILHRLGYKPARDILKGALKRESLTENQKVDIRIALSGKRYPKELRVTERQAVLMAKRERARKQQFEEAVQKRRSKEILLARAAVAPKKSKPKKKRKAVPKKKAEKKAVDTKAMLAYLDKAEKQPKAPPPPPKDTSTRKESTYFEANIEDVLVYQDPSIRSKQVAKIQPGAAYLSTQSKKVNSQRWFFLKLKKNKSGWVQGTDIQLADVRGEP